MVEMATNGRQPTGLQLNKPEIHDADYAARSTGVSVESVARTVETMLGGRAVTRYARCRPVRRDGPDRKPGLRAPGRYRSPVRAGARHDGALPSFNCASAYRAG
jgi:hypothetical protein